MPTHFPMGSPVTRIVAAALLLALGAPAVRAQQSVDVSRLPVNVDRIRRALHQATIREEREGLNLRYTVEVYGQAPPLVLFSPEDRALMGPVPYGAPTHREMIEQVTPKEYRAPAADFTGLLRWLMERAKR